MLEPQKQTRKSHKSESEFSVGAEAYWIPFKQDSRGGHWNRNWPNGPSAIWPKEEFVAFSGGDGEDGSAHSNESN